MFPWKDFLIGRIRKIQKHKEERDRSAKFKEQEGKNGGKKKKRFSRRCVQVPILMCSPSVEKGKPWGYRPHVTLPPENPFVLEPPLQHKYSVLR